MSFKLFILGQPYPDEIPPVDGAVADFLLPNANKLIVALPLMTSSDIETLNSGTVTVKVITDQHTKGIILFFSFKAKGCQLNFDCSFDSSVLPDINLESVKGPTKRIAVQLIAVDSVTKTIKALRFLTMSVELTQKFVQVVQHQLSSNFSSHAANRWVDSQRAMYTLDDMSRMPIQEHILGEV
ncbi:hypothetical protein [Vibrio coralliilyticus]|uniref:Uncharacterized protein n=1 Tax=Vibrio coralliilyticus TaxID=190893 RepID=A0AAP6ZRC6_9VIBR|nr:hypothetical protein [Vibrio coralliilyticus]NOI32005.1 hypothetical protein [Vibrio coralliilyticus]NOJ25206.1 hypothetical protein [Vibrio coralliilyticus]